MPLPLPSLDTRRWADLVEEGRALIPRYAPSWTDHNVHDPGITLLELFAWLVEQDIYRVNRIPELHRRKFLQLAGFVPRPPAPARGTLSFGLTGGPALSLPSGFTLAGGRASDDALPFRLVSPVTITTAKIAAIQSFDGSRMVDRTRQWQEGAQLAAWGEDPVFASADTDAAPALYLGLDGAPDAGDVVRLWMTFDGARSDGGERSRIEAEAAESAAAGMPLAPLSVANCSGAADTPGDAAGLGIAAGHHSLATAIEYFDGTTWSALEATDATRALTLDGLLAFKAPAAWPASEHGAVKTALRYMRIRSTGGLPDTAPMVQALAINAVEVEQSGAARMQFVVRNGVAPNAGHEPVPGAVQHLALAFDLDGAITSLAATGDSEFPEALVIEYLAAADTVPGRLVTDLVLAGVATGLPQTSFILPGAPISEGRVALWTLAAGSVRAWEPVDDLFAEAPAAAVFALDGATGRITFGDGRRGAVPPAGAHIVCRYSATAACAGNPGSAAAWRIGGADDALNEALTGIGPDTIEARVSSIASVVKPAGGGLDAVATAAGRAAETLWAHERLTELAATTNGTLDQLDRSLVLSRAAPRRAVTLADYERLALEVPGTTIARARAWAGLHPKYPCLQAPGTVAVAVVPRYPRGKPVPSAGLLGAVERYLDRRRTIGTRLVVSGPDYVEVRVRVTLHARRRADPERVRTDVDAAIRAFLDPLTGGPASRGWPFGRDVFRTEVLQVIDGVRDVDHVLELELFARDEEGACGNVCIAAIELVASGSHEVSVV